jgi:2-polyprenyl-3-methyl-5-hydroxy-6-metoxy-1,4-benzoquinol methylase
MAQLYVGGLSPDITRDDLKKLLYKFGDVVSVELVRSLETNELSGYALIRFTREEHLESALHLLDGVILKESKIKANRMPDTLPGEMQFRDWLHIHPSQILTTIGIKQGQQVLDYGCGPGIFTIACAGIVGNTGKVYALDVRQRALEQVKKQATEAGLENVELLLQPENSTGISLRDGSLDFVLVYDMMHMTQDKTGLLNNIGRVLKPDGCLSVFPMHLGNEPMLQAIRESGCFRLRDSYCPMPCPSPSTILNFIKNR